MAGDTVSRSNAIMLMLLAFMAGIFVGSVVVSEMSQPAHMQPGMQRPPAAPQAGQAAPQPQQITPAQQERLTRLEAATVQNPQDPEVWIALGNAAFGANMHKKAIAAYKQALKLQPNNADVLTDMGIMYRRSGDPGMAVESFARAMAVQPDHRQSRINTGIVLLHDLNDTEGALKAWEALLQMDPNATMPGGESLAMVVERIRKQLEAQSE